MVGPANVHEAFLATLAERSLSAPFVFHPAVYSDAAGHEKEPCDLAWIGRGCTVLINATSTGKPTGWIYDHNIKKLLGWLRKWRSGEQLRGSNQFGSYGLSFDDHRFAVLLSVASGPHAVSNYHSDLLANSVARAGRVVACASVTDSVLRSLAEKGGSLRDLVGFLDYLRLTRSVLDDTESAMIVRESLVAATTPISKLVADECLDVRFVRLAEQTLLGMRTLPGSSGTRSLRGSIVDVLSDLTAAELGIIIAIYARELSAIRHEIDATGMHDSRSVRYEIGPYRFLFGFNHSSTMGAFFSLDTERRRLDEERPDYPTTMIQCLTDPMLASPNVGPAPILMTGIGLAGASLAEEDLDRMSEAQGLEF